MVTQSHLQQSSSPRRMPGTGGCIIIWRIVWVVTDSWWNGASQVLECEVSSFFLFILWQLPFMCLFSTFSPCPGSNFKLQQPLYSPVPRWLSFLGSLLSSWPGNSPPSSYVSLLHFPFHLGSPLTAPLSFTHFSTFTLLHSLFSLIPTSQCELHTPVTWLAPLLSFRTNHHTRHPLYNSASTCSWQSSWTAWHLKTGLTGHSKTQVTNCQPMPCNIPEEKRPPLQHGGSLNSGMVNENCFHN
jgi:hypothetical protein